MTGDMAYLATVPFDVQIQGARVRIIECDECEGHPLVRIEEHGEINFHPCEDVERALAFVASVGARLLAEPSTASAGWIAIEAAMHYRRELHQAVARPTIGLLN